MQKEPEFMRTIFRSWKSGMGTRQEAVNFMRSQGMTEKAIEHFDDLFAAYLKANRHN
jgi:hypothetical protein